VSQPAVLSGPIDMRLFLIGANGRTGTEVMDLAQKRGHKITAFVRSPQKVRESSSVTVVGGNPLQCEAVATALPGHDAVLSAIGPSPRRGGIPSEYAHYGLRACNGSSYASERSHSSCNCFRRAPISRKRFVFCVFQMACQTSHA